MKGGVAMIALGCDHGGYALMQEVIDYLEKQNIEYKNFGTNCKKGSSYSCKRRM